MHHLGSKHNRGNKGILPLIGQGFKGDFLKIEKYILIILFYFYECQNNFSALKICVNAEVFVFAMKEKQKFKESQNL